MWRHLMIAAAAGMTPKQMRWSVCEVLLVPPDSNNWSDYPNVWDEMHCLISECPWYKVYEIAEALYSRLTKTDPNRAHKFANRLNQFFCENGIAWELRGGHVVFRGSEVFTKSTEKAIVALSETGRTRAANEMQEALRDISRRPQPDITGAIQHAMGALEATARDVTGQSNDTLGQLISELSLPKPLDKAVDKLWGYASDRARHIREGQAVDTAEAEMVVIVACAVCTFLTGRTQS